MKAVLSLWLILAASPALVWGQTAAASYFNPLSATEGGVHLTGVSIYSGYYTSGAASGFAAPVSSPFLAGPTAVAGIAATFSGSRQGDKSAFTWSYSPSYFNTFYGNNQFSNHGSLNHSASLTWSRKLGSRWRLSTSLNGVLANLQQLYFSPSVFSSVASFPTTFDDLAAAMLAGKFTDTQLAALLTGAPLQATPGQGYLYGSRLFNAAANVVLSWAPSGRTSVSVSATGSRAQGANNIGTFGGMSSVSGAIVPPIMTAGATVSWSYSLSPRTQIGASVGSNRTFSRLEQGYGSNGSLSIGRTMSRRWFAQASAGAGKLSYTQQTYVAPKTVQYLYTAALGFKTNSHTFLASYGRTLGDVYGLGSGFTSSATGAWTWKHPGSSWSLSGFGSYQELNNSTFKNTSSWSTGAGIAKSLSAHLFLSVQYMYAEYPAGIISPGLDNTESGVSLGLSWSPSHYR